MNIKMRLGLGVWLLAVLLAGTGCAQEKTVKVGIESDFRPFTYTEGGENKGFEIELWKAIAEKAGIKYELVPMEYGALTKALKSGEVDLIVAGMTVNDARKDDFAFSDPYFQTGLVLLTAVDNTEIRSKEDLKGKIVATKLGSTAYQYAGGLGKLKEVRGHADIHDAYDDLLAKRADAVIFDERNVHDFMQTQGKGKVRIVGEPLNKESYAVAAKKRNLYIGRINSAIAAVAKDGTYETLYMKWFGSQPRKLPGQ